MSGEERKLVLPPHLSQAVHQPSEDGGVGGSSVGVSGTDAIAASGSSSSGLSGIMGRRAMKKGLPALAPVISGSSPSVVTGSESFVPDAAREGNTRLSINSRSSADAPVVDATSAMALRLSMGFRNSDFDDMYEECAS